MTRRSLLAVSAGTMAGGLLRPSGVLAALSAPGRPVLSRVGVGTLHAGAVRELRLASMGDLVGVRWRGPASVEIQLRFRTNAGAWTRWVSAGSHGHGPEARAGSQTTVGEPIWTGGTSLLQLRASSRVSDVNVHAVDVSGGLGAAGAAGGGGARAGAAALTLAAPVLNAGAGQPPIIARSAWAHGGSPPKLAPQYGEVRMAFVHHTENPNGYSAAEVPAMLRAIYVFHRYVNGWDDIGYNFAVDLFGRIFEARAGGIDEPVVGAHAGGYNLVSSGVAVLGSFMSEPISAAARGSLERLLAWKLSLHGVPSQGRVTVRVNPAGASYSRFPANARVSLPRVAGHRDADSTDCPGNVLYGELGAIRAQVARLAPRPLRATLALLPAGAPAPPTPTSPTVPAAVPAPGTPTASTTAPAPAEATLAGTLAFLDGTPLAGATVLIQARSVSGRGEAVLERTLAQTSTDAQGGFTAPSSFAGVPAGRAWLRALCPGSSSYPAAVSPPLQVTLGSSAPPAPAPSGPAPAPPAA